MSTPKTFGEFFRSRRKTLGLSQSEFCRRNGFDKGNISRLERGLVPPPQDRELLGAYAAALKLKEGTADWERFSELAGIETGRIPADILDDPRAMRHLSEGFRTARARGFRHIMNIRALDLERWADELEARERLPQLVRMLVRATGKFLGRVEYPAFEGIQRHGWDGLVEAGEGDEFVPAGRSRWEMGVDANPGKKAERDFTNRTKLDDPEKQGTTFVFVTPRKWTTKEKWRREKETLGIWKEVRVYDSASLEEWLEQAPVVNAWLAWLLGKKPPGITVIEDYWANLERVTLPKFKPEVFLASRDDQVKELGKWLDGPPGARRIEGRSPVEALDFVVAFGQLDAEADRFATQAVIVDDRNAWRALASSARGLILIADPRLPIEPELVAEAERRGHHVLLPSSLTWSYSNSIRLPGSHRGDLEKALVSSGLNEERARRAARESGRSLTILKRILGRLPATIHPEWSQPAEARSLVPLLLAGSWDGDSEADRAAVGELSDQAYEAVERIAERWRSAPDPPLMRLGSRWSLVSRDDSWHFLGSQVSPSDLQRFEQVARKVLAQDDPAYEMPPDRRWLTRPDDPEPRFSGALRTGLAETLAILGARQDGGGEISVPGAGGLDPNPIVRDLLDNQRWIHWASLAEQLPLLAEAAPDAFLGAIERDLKRPESSVVRLFREGDHSLLARNPHVWVLSALEGLAWSRDYLASVSRILADLDEVSPRIASGNSAKRSLLHIFMPWLPQTAAPVEERVQILRMLTRHRPEAAWRLLLDLLPNQQETSTSIRRPVWRDWALEWSPSVSNVDYWRQVIDSAQLLLDQIGDNLSRWISLIERFEGLRGPTRAEFLRRLGDLAGRLHDDGDRRQIADALRNTISMHHRFSQANWALTPEALGELEAVQRRFEPGDPVRKNAWLFELNWRLPATLEGGEDRLIELRRSAVREILDQNGWDGLRALVGEAKAPETIGAAIAEADRGEHESRIIPDLLTAPDDKFVKFANEYIRKRFHDEGWAWVDRLDMTGWSPEQVARFLIVLPFERRTWELAATRGEAASSLYWSLADPRLPTDGKSVDEVKAEARQAVTMLLERGRSPEAIFALVMARSSLPDLDSDLLLDTLEAALEILDRLLGHAAFGLVDFGIPLLIQELQRRCDQNEPGLDPRRLARLEFGYLHLLEDDSRSPAVLHRTLQDEPEFFVEVLGFVYRPRNSTAERESEYSDQEKLRAAKAYQLLRSWKNIPGRSGENTVNEQILTDWVRRARSLAGQRGILEACDSTIGELLAHAPGESDGSWPCIPVREVLEEIGTNEILGGWDVGIVNNRCLSWKSLREGGVQERELASKYRAFAEAARIDYPRTAEALREVSKFYENQARQEDDRATLD